MQINEAIGVLDKYHEAGVSDESVAWECVRNFLVKKHCSTVKLLDEYRRQLDADTYASIAGFRAWLHRRAQDANQTSLCFKDF